MTNLINIFSLFDTQAIDKAIFSCWTYEVVVF